MKKQLFILVLVCFIFQYAFAQISEGGTPVSFSLGIDVQKEKVAALVMPPVDIKALLQEDENTKMEGTERPFRFGYAIDVDIDVKKEGVKKELPNGDKLWLLKIHSPDAFSINLIYDRFQLCKGSKFFIYNEDKTMLLGAFTPEVSNNSHNEFATDLVQGNTIILEYYEPKSSDDGVIHINKVIHGYVNTFASDGLGTSAGCNIDVMCRPFGNNWVNEERAVAMLLVNNNTAFCSSCLVNNTQQDFTPYVLTARHCYFNQNGNTQTTFPATNIIRFQYWRPNCGSGNPITTRSITGATLLAHNAFTDFALLRLNARPPADWNVYYAGWDRTTTPAQNVTAIHHPRGDAMKISHEQDPVFAQNHPIQGHALSTWRVQHFEQGTIEPGSSGSPLFNQNRRIVGQLSTGNDNTGACINRSGNYGRFDLSWTGGGTNATRLSNWLDPTNTGAMTTNTLRSPAVTGPASVCPGSSATFTADNFPGTVTWTCSSNLTMTDNGNTATVTSNAPLNTPSGKSSEDLSTVYSRDEALRLPPIQNSSIGWIRASVEGTTFTAEKQLTVNTVDIASLTIPSDMRTGSVYTITGNVNESAPYTESWSIIPNKSVSMNSPEKDKLQIGFGVSGNYALTMNVTNLCGTGSKTASFRVSGFTPCIGCGDTPGPNLPSPAYPNPASDVINIELGAEATVHAKSIGHSVFDVRLYDAYGNLLRQAKAASGTVQFNVSNLPNGLYYLHVYDGVNKTPEVRQIMVKH